MEMRAVHEARGNPDGVYFDVNDGRLPQRDTVLRSLYEAVRSQYIVFYTTSHLILSLVNTQISLAILSALVAISSAE